MNARRLRAKAAAGRDPLGPAAELRAAGQGSAGSRGRSAAGDAFCCPAVVLWNRILSVSCNQVSAQEGATLP